MNKGSHRLGVKHSRLPLAEREELGLVGWRHSELAKPWNPPLRIVELKPRGRTMPPGWAKAIFAQLRKIPIFNDDTERNLYRRWKRRELSTARFKELVRAHTEKAKAA